MKQRRFRGAARLFLAAGPGVLGLVSGLAAGGCSIGPRMVVTDRIDYGEAIAESWRRQTLLNIVRLRYVDTPIFLEVSSVISSYHVEGGVSVGSGLNTTGRAVSGVDLRGAGTMSASPTITYTPVTGNTFLRSLMDPVPPYSVLHLIESGYPADFVLELGVDSINGLHNRSAHGGETRRADPEFLRLAALMREVQMSGVFGMKVERPDDGPATASIFFRRDRLTAEMSGKVAEIKSLLGLADDADRYAVVYSPVRSTAGELAVDSRSVLQMMGSLASFVDVPASDVAEGRAREAPDLSQWAHPLIRVRCGEAAPKDAFVSVAYRGRWFWIDDTDWWSKRTFSTILFMFTLADSGSVDRGPMVTIPAR